MAAHTATKRHVREPIFATIAEICHRFCGSDCWPTQQLPQSLPNWPTLQLLPGIDHRHGSILLDVAREERVELSRINHHHGSIPIVKIYHLILRQRLLAPRNSFHNRCRTGQRCNYYRARYSTQFNTHCQNRPSAASGNSYRTPAKAR